MHANPNANLRKTFRTPFYKRAFYGTLSIGLTAVLLVLAYFVITGAYFPDNVFSTVIRATLGVFFLIFTWSFFFTSLDRVIIDGDTLTLRTGVFRPKTVSIALPTITRIEAGRTSFAQVSIRKPYDILILTGERPDERFILNILFLRKQDRREILRILEPIILRPDATRESDRPNIQHVLSSWDNEAPVQLTANAQELARRSKKNTRLIAILLIVLASPLFLLFFVLLPIGWFTVNQKCNDLLDNGKITTARILSVDPTASARTPDKIEGTRLTIAYEADGRSYNENLNVSYSSRDANRAFYDKIKNSKSIEIRYSPTDPSSIDVADNFKDGTTALCMQ